jgi:hypothetical protein
MDCASQYARLAAAACNSNSQQRGADAGVRTSFWERACHVSEVALGENAGLERRQEFVIGQDFSLSRWLARASRSSP